MLLIMLPTERLWAQESSAPAPPPPASAATAPADTAWTQAPAASPALLGVDADEGPSLSGLVARLIGGLGLVVLLAWGGVWLLRRLGWQQPAAGATGPIRLGQRVYLGPKKLLCMVEIGDRTLALGITDQCITCLAEWRAGELPVRPEEPARAGFAAHLRARLGDRPPAAGASDGGQG